MVEELELDISQRHKGGLEQKVGVIEARLATCRGWRHGQWLKAGIDEPALRVGDIGDLCKVIVIGLDIRS